MTQTVQATTAARVAPAQRRGSVLPVFATTLRSILLTKRTPILFAVLLIPLIVTIIIYPVMDRGDYEAFDGVDVPSGRAGQFWFEDSMNIIFLGLLLPLVVAFYATSLIGDEVANKTLPYLFVRPVRRWMVLLAKFAAFSVATFALAALAVVIQFFVALSATQNPWAQVGELSAVLGVVALAVLANGALFALIGVSVRYPLVFAIIYFVLWENILGAFPGQIKRFSFIFYERTLVTVAADRTNFLDEFLGLKVSAGAAIATMLVATAVLLAGACFVVSYKDYNV